MKTDRHSAASPDRGSEREPCAEGVRPSPLHQSFIRRIDAHFARTISPAEEEQLRRHLPDCSPCRGYYDRNLLLEELDPDGGDAKSRIAVGLGLRVGRTPFQVGFVAAAAVAAAVTIPVLGSVLSWHGAGGPVALAPSAAEAEYTPRGAADNAAAPHLFIYRLAPNRPTERVNGTIAAKDELAFAYTNGGNFERLLVFGVDEHRHIYWYHPAWSNEGENPVGVPIAPGPGVHELGEAVSQSLDGHTLRITAVFTRDRLAVKEVEKMVSDANMGDIDFARAKPGSAEVVTTVEVTP